MTIEAAYGVPVVAMHTDKFDQVVRSVSAVNGMPGLRQVFVPQPIMGKTAAQLLASLSAADLAQALRDFGDEPDADAIAEAIVAARQDKPLERTRALVDLILRATGQTGWRLHPSAGRWTSRLREW